MARCWAVRPARMRHPALGQRRWHLTSDQRWADQGGQPDEALSAEFQKMIAMRKAHPVLRRGTLLAPLWLADCCVALARKLGQGRDAVWAVSAFNNSQTPRNMTLALPPDAPSGRYFSAWGEADASATDGQMTLTVPALSGRVLIGR